MYMKSGSSKKKMDYFLAYYQLYYWRIRTPYDLPGEVDFFREITQMINDTFTTVSPNLTLCKSLEEAENAVKTGEEEIMKTLKTKAPQLLQAIGLGSTVDTNVDGLQTIMEEDGQEEQNNDDPLYNDNNKEDDNVEDNDSYDESGSDYEDQEENDVNEDVDGDDDSETEEDDEDTMEEAEDGDDLMDTDDEDSERKELVRGMEEWSVKSKPKLIGNS